MSKIRQVAWSPAATEDLIEIWLHYAEVATPEVADTVLRDIGRSAALIKDRPLLSRDRNNLKRGLRSILVRPYVLFFRINHDSIHIARVLHGRRDFNVIPWSVE